MYLLKLFKIYDNIRYRLNNLKNKSINTTGNNTANVITIEMIAPVIPLPISDFRNPFIPTPPQDSSCLNYIIS
jgi:hypothetical protein